MNAELATEIIKAMILHAVALATPLLLAAMVVGLGVSLFQAVTSIHEQTLSFVPKALAVVGLLIVLLPWMIRSTSEFAIAIIEKIPQMVH